MPDDLIRKEQVEHAKVCIDRFTEVTKARLTLWTFLALAMITLAGIAVQNKRSEFFYLAAFVPMLAIVVDLLVKYLYSTPYLYKGIRLEYELYGRDATSLLLLSYGETTTSPLPEIFELTDESDRQRKFRSVYMKHGLMQKIRICGAGSSLALYLAFAIR